MYNVHEDAQVLIIGGGLTGLCASLFLSHWGVDSILAERHPGTSPQPKARRINLRTMESFRQIGVEGRVTEAAAPLADFQGMAAGPTVAESAPLPFTLPGGVPRWDEISPAASVLCAQDILEPVLRDLATGRGGDVRFGAEVLDPVLDAGGVTATVRGPGARGSRIRADYVIAADGPRSPVRERLGIARRTWPGNWPWCCPAPRRRPCSTATSANVTRRPGSRRTSPACAGSTCGRCRPSPPTARRWPTRWP